MNKAPLKFIFLLAGIYFLLYYACIFWIALCSEGGLYWKFAEENLNFFKGLREFLIAGAEFICSILGLQTASNSTDMRIIGHGGIRIVYSCIGYGIMSLLIALGITLPYKPLKERLIFIFTSLGLFLFLNMLRLVLVAYYAAEARKYSINHHDIFNYICYIFIFAGMYWWIIKKTAA